MGLNRISFTSTSSGSGWLGATHLFEEPGALDQVVERATRWFLRYLAGAEKKSA